MIQDRYAVSDDRASGLLRNKIYNLFFALFLSLSSGFLLYLAFPGYSLPWLAWVGLVPLLIAITGRSLRYTFCLSLVSGIVYFAGNFQWMLKVHEYRIYHQAILTTFMGLYFGFFGLAFCYTSKRLGPIYAHLSAPFIWVALEYLRSHFFFLALPWVLLAHSQYQAGSLIQVSAFTGEYGISFLIVMVNSAIALNILYFYPKLKRFRAVNQATVSKKGVLRLTLTSA